MTDLTQYQKSTLEIVSTRSQRNPITGLLIAGIIGLKERKSGKYGADLRSIIHALRVKGYPICASGKGYWWPENTGQLSAYIVQFKARVDDQYKAVKGMQSGFHKVGMVAGQAEVKKTVVHVYRVEDRVYKVTGDDVDKLLEKFPNAVQIQ